MTCRRQQLDRRLRRRLSDDELDGETPDRDGSPRPGDHDLDDLGRLGPSTVDRRRRQEPHVVRPKLTFRFETETGIRRRVKLEINTHEHFGHVVPRLMAIPASPVSNSAAVPTYELDELLATKLRALYQRSKGRDVFDLWWAHEQADPDPARIVSILGDYEAAAGKPMIRARELRANLAARRTRGSLEEVRPLLRPGFAYDGSAALDWVEATFVPLLP